MNRRALLLLTAMTAAVLALAAGVALADNITCSTNPCTGTDQNDVILGTNDPEEIRALGGNDIVGGQGGNDQVYGGLGADDLSADGGSDLLSGGGGADQIDARENAHAGTHVPGTDTVKGGGGNDHIDALDGAVDHIDCGKGRKDEFIRDKGMDTIANCEVR